MNIKKIETCITLNTKNKKNNLKSFEKTKNILATNTSCEEFIITRSTRKLDTIDINENNNKFYKMKLKEKFTSLEIEKLEKVGKYFNFGNSEMENDLKKIKEILNKFRIMKNNYFSKNQKSRIHFLKVFIYSIDDILDSYLCLFLKKHKNGKNLFLNFTDSEKKTFSYVLNSVNFKIFLKQYLMKS